MRSRNVNSHSNLELSIHIDFYTSAANSLVFLN